jgi:hypothetical protein
VQATISLWKKNIIQLIQRRQSFCTNSCIVRHFRCRYFPICCLHTDSPHGREVTQQQDANLNCHHQKCGWDTSQSIKSTICAQYSMEPDRARRVRHHIIDQSVHLIHLPWKQRH